MPVEQPSAMANLLYAAYCAIPCVLFVLAGVLLKRFSKRETGYLPKVLLALGLVFGMVTAGFLAMALVIQLGTVFNWYYW